MTISTGSAGKRPVQPYPFFAKDLEPPQNTDQLLAQLKRAVLGHALGGSPKKPQVLARGDDGFTLSSAIFNGAVKTPALALVKPVTALDVSRTVIFCKENGLELSVKGGGHGVHGWSVAGHVILDLSLMDDISIVPPNPYPPTLQESFEALRLSDTSKPKGPSPPSGQGPSKPTLAKRPADGLSDDGGDDSELHGKRRALATGGVPLSRTDDSGSGSGSGSNSDSNSNSRDTTQPSSISTAATSLPDYSPHPSHPRITYVNPSQTPTSSFPFLPPTVGPSSSASLFFPNSGYQSSYLNLLPQQQPAFNTNPNPPSHTLVTFGAGIRSKQLDAVTSASPYGAFHVPTSAFPVGSGQFLSGGFGFLGRKHGYAMDNLVEVEMVLADGRIIWVGEGGAKGGDWKEGEDPEDVWWAVRGAGAVMGVVTRFRAKAYYTPSVYAGILIYMFDHDTTPSLLRHVRDCIKGSPPTVYANIILTAGPPGAPAIVVFQLCFSGNNARSEGETYVQAISSWDGATSMFMDFSERTFEKQQLAVEDLLKGGYGRKWFIKSDLLTSFTDEIIDETCARFHSVPDGCTWLFEYTGSGHPGSPTATSKSCVPASHRQVAFTVAALHQWAHDETPEDDTRCIVTADEWIKEVIHSNSPGGPLPCFLQSNAQQDVIGTYGPENFERLKELKAKLDPDNMFKHAMWPDNSE